MGLPVRRKQNTRALEHVERPGLRRSSQLGIGGDLAALVELLRLDVPIKAFSILRASE